MDQHFRRRKKRKLEMDRETGPEKTSGCNEDTLGVKLPKYSVEETNSCSGYGIAPSGSKSSLLCNSVQNRTAALYCSCSETMVAHRFHQRLENDLPAVLKEEILAYVKYLLTSKMNDKDSFILDGDTDCGMQIIEKKTGEPNLDFEYDLVYSSLMNDTDICQNERKVFSEEYELRNTEHSFALLKLDNSECHTCEIELPEPDDNALQTRLKKVVNSEVKSDSESNRSPTTISSSLESSDDFPSGYPRYFSDSYTGAKASLSSQVFTESVTGDGSAYITEPLFVQFMGNKIQKGSFLFEIVDKFVMFECTENNCIEDFVFVEMIEDVLLTGMISYLDHQHDRNDTVEGQEDSEKEPYTTQTHECNVTNEKQTDLEFGQTDVIDSISYGKIQSKERAELVEANFADNKIDSNGYSDTPQGIDAEENVATQIDNPELSGSEFLNVQHASNNVADVQQEVEKNDDGSRIDLLEIRQENKEANHVEDEFREIKLDPFHEDKKVSVVQNEVLEMKEGLLGKQCPILLMVLGEKPLKQIVMSGFTFSVTFSPFERYCSLTWIDIGRYGYFFFQEEFERANQERNEGTDTPGLRKINFVPKKLCLEPFMHVSELNDSGEQICLEKELKQQQKKSGKQRKKHMKKKKKTSRFSTFSPPSMMGYQLPSSDSSIEDENLYRHSKPRKYCRKCQKNCSHCLCASSHFQPRAETEENVFEALINQQSLDSGLGTMQSLYSFHSSLESIAKQKLLSMKKATAAKTLKEVESIKSSLCSLEERIKGITRDLSHFRPINVDVALYPGLNSYFERFPSGSTPTLSQQMQFEWLRVSSFGTYTGQGSCINLARNGFYAESDAGPAATRCCKCGVVVTDWEYLDNVADRHRQLSPNCPFVTGRDTEEGNVSIFDEASTTTYVTPEPQVNTGTSEGASALSVGHLANAEFTSVASTRSATQASSSSSSGASSSESSKSQENKLTSVPGDSKEVEPYQPVEDAENQSLPRLGGGTRDKPAQAAPPSRPPGNNAPGTSGAVGAGAFASQGGGGGAMTATRSLLDEMISTLENQLGGEWMLVALNLGLTQVDIERTQELEPHSTRRQIQSALTRWRKSSAFTDMGKIESLIQALEESGRNDLADVLKDRRDALRRSESNPGASGSPMPLEGVGNPEFVIVENPKHPNYSSVDARISSYRGWPSTLGQSARQMAAAGFYYAGVSDFTRCFCCGGGLRNWETGDDPILEHTRWFPECEFVNRLKGRTYVNRISRRQEEHLAAQRRQALEQERRLAALRNAPDPLESAAAQTLLEMGYPQERVRTAITELRRTSGNVTVSADQAVRFLLDEEERQPGSQDIPPVVTGGNLTQRSTLTNASNSARAGSPVGPQSLRAGGSSATGTQGASVGSESQAGSLTSNVSTTAVAGSLTGKVQGKSSPATVIEGKDTSGEKRNSKSGKKKKKKTKAPTQGSNLSGEVHGEIDAQSLRVENERLRDMHKCKICMERMVDTTILPCGHLVCCGECASRVNQCPICRAQIKGTVKTFLS